MKFLKEGFKTFEQSLNFQSDFLNELQTSLKNISKENQNLRTKNEILETRIQNLEKEMEKITRKNQKEANEEREKNIVIVGIKTENNTCPNDVLKLFNKIGVPVSLEQFKAKVLPSNKIEKPILVTFLQKSIRDKIMERRKQFGILTVADCGLGTSDRKVFVNEDLPLEVKNLLLRARRLKSKNYKYVWSKHSKVFARKEDGSEVIKIMDEKHVELLLS